MANVAILYPYAIKTASATNANWGGTNRYRYASSVSVAYSNYSGTMTSYDSTGSSSERGNTVEGDPYGASSSITFLNHQYLTESSNLSCTATFTCTPPAGFEFSHWVGRTFSAQQTGAWHTLSTSATLSITLKNSTGANDYSLVAAVCKRKQYTITLKASPSYGGTVSGGGTVYHGDSVTITATPETHFAFVKWQNASGTTVSTSASYTFTASTNVTLTAVFASTESLVVFNANGGSVSPAFKSIYKGDTYGTLPTPTRSGYTFSGWYTSASGGSQVYASTTVTASGNHSIYAHWTASAAATSTVTFNANGGSTSLTTLTMTNGATTNSLVAVATRSNYSFLGWFSASSGGEMVFGPTGEAVAGSFWREDYSASSNNAKWSTSGAKTLYARWGNHTCTVTFDPNWGSESSTRATYLDGKPYGSLPVPSRSGYNFTGWYTAASGGTLVTPADNASTTTLYAHWERPDSVTWLLVTIT